LRHQGLVAGGLAGGADDVHIVLHRLAGGFLGRLEQRADVHVEADDQSLRKQEDSARILVLLSLSYKKIGSEFDLLVKQFENIMDSLGAVETYVQMIRSVRDEIRAELVIWDELIEEWRAYTAKESDGNATQVIEHTYRFLAQNYPIVQVWQEAARSGVHSARTQLPINRCTGRAVISRASWRGREYGHWFYQAFELVHATLQVILFGQAAAEFG
jgi:hypothetical protein